MPTNRLPLYGAGYPAGCGCWTGIESFFRVHLSAWRRYRVGPWERALICQGYLRFAQTSPDIETISDTFGITINGSSINTCRALFFPYYCIVVRKYRQVLANGLVLLLLLSRTTHQESWSSKYTDVKLLVVVHIHVLNIWQWLRFMTGDALCQGFD